MPLEPVDPNERFRSRRRQARRRRAIRRVLLLTVVALTAAALALGISFLGGRDGRPAASAERPTASAGSGAATVKPDPEPVAMPDEVRGVHVTMALASLDGKLEEF